MEGIINKFKKMSINSVKTNQVCGYEILLVEYFGVPLREFNNTPHLYTIFNSQILEEILSLDKQGKIRNKGELLYINLTPEQLLCEESFELLIKMQGLNSDNSHIVIELTEIPYENNIALLKDRISELKKIKVKLAIDDFGSDHSNFFRLHKLKPDIVKIDRSIFEDNIKDILKELVSYLHKLNIEVIVEGVESHSDLEIVKESKADYFQGFFLDKPQVIE
jgi:EAL domain-containing protein (putative c-di-GMP-specific phosphodiesterase class I)